MFRRALVVPVVATALSLTALTACDSDDELTKPGSELKFGESARVSSGDEAGTLKLTVEKIEQGDAADLRAIGSTDVEGKTPYYVRVEVTPESGTQPIDLDDYLAVFAGDAPLTHLSVLVDFPQCQEAPITVDELDAPQDACLVYLADAGAPEPDAVYFDNDDDYSAYDGNAVSWK